MKRLTLRENEILKLLIKGYSNSYIANQLFITESTVKAHVSSILRKLSAKTRIEVVVYALKNDLIKF